MAPIVAVEITKWLLGIHTVMGDTPPPPPPQFQAYHLKQVAVCDTKSVIPKPFHEHEEGNTCCVSSLLYHPQFVLKGLFILISYVLGSAAGVRMWGKPTSGC